MVPCAQDVFDITGRNVRTLLANTPFTAGEHRVSWDGRIAGGEAAPGGVYILQVHAAGEVKSARVVLVR
jgi:hypothetical protein